MGNNISSCCGAADGFRCCCLGRGGRSMKSGKMVPADLHSSGAQTSSKGQKKPVVQSRPTTLPTQSTSAGASTSSGQARQEGNKFSEFSLHGVQKTSPVEQADDSMDGLQSSVQHKFLMENVSSLFNEYKEIDCDEILAEGISKFCNDLEVDPAEFIVLALAWKFKAETMCRFSRDEFTQGCIALQADSIESIKQSFPDLENEARINFKDIYKFAFQFGLDSDQGQRSLPSDVAIGMWQVVFSKDPPQLLDEWIKFLEESKIRGISRDTWNMFLHFTENVGSDLSNYDDNEAWPSLFDDFVEYYRMSIAVKETTDKFESNESQKEEDIDENLHTVNNEIAKNEAVTHSSTEPNLPGSIPVQHEEQEVKVPDDKPEDIQENIQKTINHDENNDTTAIFRENVVVETPATEFLDSKQLEPASLNLEKPDISSKNGDSHSTATQKQNYSSDFEGEKENSKLSLTDFPSTSEEPSSEFDSEPIRCETLHSSHLS
uniref:DCN1-like protein 3 n=1 Tax=Styela clava TaxID=7725 RepID=UPI001939C925|nr:DCN1-like protein 3 [Styela clava]